MRYFVMASVLAVVLGCGGHHDPPNPSRFEEEKFRQELVDTYNKSPVIKKYGGKLGVLDTNTDIHELKREIWARIEKAEQWEDLEKKLGGISDKELDRLEGVLLEMQPVAAELGDAPSLERGATRIDVYLHKQGLEAVQSAQKIYGEIIALKSEGIIEKKDEFLRLYNAHEKQRHFVEGIIAYLKNPGQTIICIHERHAYRFDLTLEVSGKADDDWTTDKNDKAFTLGVDKTTFEAMADLSVEQDVGGGLRDFKASGQVRVCQKKTDLFYELVTAQGRQNVSEENYAYLRSFLDDAKVGFGVCEDGNGGLMLFLQEEVNLSVMSLFE